MKGIILGKFLPLHRGHCLMIEMAMGICDELHIFVCSRIEEKIPGVLRYDWVQKQFASPHVRVHHITKEIQEANAQNPSAPSIWANEIAPYLDMQSIEYVFTSETYGELFSKELGAQWIPIDPNRAIVPISGQEIRENIYKNWEYLAPVVQSHYSRIIGIRGERQLIENVSKKLQVLLCNAYSLTIEQVLSKCNSYKLDNTQFEQSAQAFIHAIRNQGIPLVICQISNDNRLRSLIQAESQLFNQYFELEREEDIESIIAWWDTQKKNIIHS